MRQVIIDSVAWVPKNSLSEEKENSLKYQLSISNKNYGRWNASMNSVDYRKRLDFFREDENYYIVPRNFLMRIFSRGECEYLIRTEEGVDIDVEFTAKLRSYQQRFIDSNPQFLKPNDRIFLAGCGSGKTVMSIYTICQIKKATLVLVPTNYLVGQYYKSCKAFTKGANIVAGSSNKSIDWQNADILIMTYKLFLNRQFPDGFNKRFGHFVVDEGHRIGSDSYEDIVPMIYSNRRTLLTATLRRSDGAEKIVRYHFGKPFEMKSPNPKVKCIPVNTGYKVATFIKKKKSTKTQNLEEFLSGEGIKVRKTKDYIYLESWYNVLESVAKSKYGKSLDPFIRELKRNITNFNYSALDTIVSQIPERTKEIAEFVVQKARQGRKVLVLSKRKQQLFDLNKIISSLGGKSFVVVSGVSEEDIPEDYEIILGIDKMAKEGLDLPALDLLVLTHAIGDTEQAFGRVARITDDNKEPEAYYMIDDSEPYKKLFKKSTRYISKNGFISEKQNGLLIGGEDREDSKNSRSVKHLKTYGKKRPVGDRKVVRKSIRKIRIRPR